MKLAIAIAFLFIGLVHSATISTESLDALKTKPALSTVDTIETVPVATETKDKRETLTKTENIDTKTTETDARLSVDTTSVDANKRSFNTMSMDIPDGMNASQCIYKPDESLLTCKGPTETVECKTPFMIGSFNATAHHVYGISAVPCTDATKCTLETSKFWLFPRKIENTTTYLNHTFANGTVDLQLWSGEWASNVLGLNVADVACYTKRAKVITEGCKTPRMSRVTSNWTNTVEEVGLCGEILVLDKTVQKRWLYGYGWGLGGLGSLWGWGGYPYYGYWWGK